MIDEAKLKELINDIASSVLPEDLSTYNLQYILCRGYSSMGFPGIECANKMIRLLAIAQLEDGKDKT